MAVATELPLIPPARLAALFVQRRTRLNFDLVTLSQRSGGRFPPSYLQDIEKGRLPNDEAVLRELIALYELDSGPIALERSKLILDLESNQISVDQAVMPFESPTVDMVLERYVSLVYLLRNETPGRKLPLRDDDLDVLGSTFDRRTDRLRDELVAIMLASATEERTSLLGRRLAIGAAGLLVGVTTVGSLVIVGSNSGSDAQPVADGDSISMTQSGGQGIVVPGLQTASTLKVESAASGGAGGFALLPTSRTAPPLQAAVLGQVATATPDAGVEATLTSASTRAVAAVPETPTTELGTDHDHDGHDGHDHDVEVVGVDGSNSDEIVGSAIDLSAIENHLGLDIDGLVPGWTIEFSGDRPGYKGLTDRHNRTIAVYVDDDDSVGTVAGVLIHEVGHAIDIDRLDESSRLEWIQLREIPPVWWAGDGLTDFSVGAGDFAEAVAAYLAGSASQSAFGDFTPEQLAFVGSVVG